MHFAILVLDLTINRLLIYKIKVFILFFDNFKDYKRQVIHLNLDTKDFPNIDPSSIWILIPLNN